MIRHGIPSTSLDQAERQLPPLWVFVALDKCLKVRRHFRHLHVAPPADFVGNIFRDIPRPALGYIEADDAHGVFILAIE